MWPVGNDEGEKYPVIIVYSVTLVKPVIIGLLKKSQQFKKYINIYILGHGKTSILSKIFSLSRFKPGSGIRYMWVAGSYMKIKMDCRDRSLEFLNFLYLL